MAIERTHVGYATAAVAVAAIPLSFVGPETLRLAVVGLFLLAGPGTALVLLLRFNPAGSALAGGAVPLATALAIAASLTLSTLVATAMIYAHVWAPPVGICVLALATLALLAVDIRRTRSAPVVAQ